MAGAQLGLKSLMDSGMAGWLITSEAAAMLQGRLCAPCVARTQPVTRVRGYRQHDVCGVANSLLCQKSTNFVTGCWHSATAFVHSSVHSCCKAD